MTRRSLAWVLVVEAAVIAGGTAVPSRTRDGGPAVRVVSSLVDVFPDRAPPPGDAAARLEAARGEWESVQVALGGPLRHVRARATVLRADGGATLPAPSLARVASVEIQTPSSIEGRPGRWPDPLIPDVDGYAGEHRRAFPFDVAAGGAGAIWVDVFVPPGAAAGRYRGAIEVSWDGGARRVPLEVRVRGFTLPATSSIPVTFGVSYSALAQSHGLRRGDGEARAALGGRYALALLRHRISVHGGTMDPPPWTVQADDTVTLDTRAYDAEVAAFLDGKADPGGPAEGARWTAVDLRLPARLHGPARTAYTRAMLEHLRKNGWLDRVFLYAYDEPAPAAFAEVQKRSAALREISDQIPRLVTHAPVDELLQEINLWCPVVNLVDPRPGTPGLVDKLAALRAKGAHAWWYQSCLSHGCDIVGGEEFTGWPSYAIDAPPVAHRVFEWLTVRFGLEGELYYNVAEAQARGRDPWEEPQAHGGNGDGTLVYPGTPARIGGRTDIPIESIRLKRIRDGLEDLEYLKLYAHSRGAEQAVALAASIAPHAWSWQHDPARLLAARHELAVALDATLAAR